MNVSGKSKLVVGIFRNLTAQHGLDFLTYRGVEGQPGEVDGVELNVEVRVEEEAGGVVSEVQSLTHHHHHHPQPRPPGGGLHTAGLPRVQGGVA